MKENIKSKKQTSDTFRLALLLCLVGGFTDARQRSNRKYGLFCFEVSRKKMERRFILLFTYICFCSGHSDCRDYQKEIQA